MIVFFKEVPEVTSVDRSISWIFYVGHKARVFWGNKTSSITTKYIFLVKNCLTKCRRAYSRHSWMLSQVLRYWFIIQILLMIFQKLSFTVLIWHRMHFDGYYKTLVSIELYIMILLKNSFRPLHVSSISQFVYQHTTFKVEDFFLDDLDFSFIANDQEDPV